ncbi:hypothetical protein TNCV_2300711 [Trichonephila clavipes]|nr:hypothetical protein TNCV_2300711 [Trichonephila clavipes]
MSDTKKYFCPRLLDYIVFVGARQPSRNHAVQTPELLRRYPAEDHKDFPLSPDVVYFCQPEGCVCIGPKRVSLRESNSFVFALTEKDTSRVRYGICVNFYRAIERRPSTKEKARDRAKKKLSKVRESECTTSQESRFLDPKRDYSSRCHQDDSDVDSKSLSPVIHQHIKSHSLTSLCIISHHPFFSTFRECLFILRKLIDACNERNLSRRSGGTKQSRESVWSFLTGRLSENTPPSVLHGIRELEMWMLRLLSAPVPVPGKTRVEVEILPRDIQPPLTFALPDHTRFSLVDFPLHLPLELLGVNTCMKVLTCIILEHKQGIEPFILYGSRVWGEALKRKMNSKYLRRIQRRILLRVICGYRTISYDSVYAISGFPPIDITILHDIAFRENLSASSISNYDCILSPFFIPHPSERNAINIVQFSDKSTDFPVICYTDGSKIDGRVGFAFAVFRSGVESENFQFRIRDECTVFVAELLCLNFAVKWITEQNSVISEYLICTDSLSSLDSLKCISSSNNIIVEIQKQLKSLRDKNISIDFAFVRGHTGVLGNERADWLAKAATKRKIDIDINIPKSFYKKITNERMMKSWNQEYLISNKGSITKKFFPTINKRLSCHHFYTNYKLTQFLTGHGNFKSYLNKFNLAPSSFCDCNIGGEENVEHVILLCSKYVRERKIIRLAFKRLNINWPPNFHQFLSTRSAFNNFCKFVVTVCNPS